MAGQLDVEAGGQGERRRVAFARGDSVMSDEQHHGEIVGDDDAVEAELVSQQTGEDRRVACARDPVHGRVRIHDRLQPGVADGGGERLRVHLAQLARPELHRRVIHPALRECVPEEVLSGRDDTVVEAALQGTDVRGTDAAGEVRVLAVGLFDASPTRVARDVEHGRERLARADGDELLPDHVGDLGDERLVPRRGQPDRLREHRRTTGAVTAGRLLVDDDGDTKARLFDGEPLDLVHQRGALGRQQSRGRTDTGDVADAVADDPSGRFHIEASIVDE